MGGRVIGCLRTKYANTKIELEPKCFTELIDVIQTSKLDIKLDVKLYQKCGEIVRAKCPGVDKEDCLKLMFQKQQITNLDCKKEVTRIIREGQADVHVDHSLSYTCQTDLIKYCNDIPIGNAKQLQCLLKKKKLVTKQCKDILLKRQELWSKIPDVNTFDDLTWHIINSENNGYFYTAIVIVLLFVFTGGCICRSCVRRRRVSKYN